MRIRPLIALSAIAVTGVLLAGCSGQSEAEPTPSSSGAADLCSSAASSGAASDAVTVEGDEGAEPVVTFTAPAEVTAIERTVAIEGTGEKIAEGDLVRYGIVAYDAETGEKLGSAGYEEGTALPIQVTAQGAGQLLGCATIGSRIVLALPGDEESASQINVIDLLGLTPTAAWGADQAPVEGMPEVEVADDGTPSVTIPDSAAPTELRIAVLKKGDGPVVTSSDRSLIQYYGVNWADGTSFDSTWSRGAAYAPQGDNTGYVKGFTQALEGQTVGSQVLVVIPPELGYGDQAQGDIPANSTLVFVIDILATQHPTAAQ